jgi:uncharacterized alkaline shock family protein YloU
MTYVLQGSDGTITITDSALTQVVVQAAEAVEGARVRRARRRLEVAIADGRATVELELAVRYGRVLPEVARAVQERVSEALGTMCGLDVERVDVAIEELER